MICESITCGILAWGTLGFATLLCACITAVAFNLGGLARRAAPQHYALFVVLPPPGRWIWRATLLCCASLLALFGLAVSFFPDLWVVAIWLSSVVSPWVLIGAAVSMIWAVLRSAKNQT